ncbi:hypothetical protein BDZ89DRAFT_1102091 [Hymenopellis radicata]|nr:hypothetical protein BDZ89DRAFT_1102091 [Hymenopellis radicata]
MQTRRFGFFSVVLFSLWKSSLGSLLVPKYDRVPLGAVKPSGWALDYAKVQADGLPGHLMDWAAYVKGSIWSPGGSLEYSEMHEAAPYWFNALVPLAFQLEDSRLIGQVQTFLEHNLDLAEASDDGWIGPEVFNASATVPRLVWPRYLMLMALAQYAEADPAQTERIVTAMHRFVDLAYTIWKSDAEGEPSMGFQFEYQYVRWEELVHSLQWLYDYYPQGKEDMLVELMGLVRDSGFSWKNDWYTDDKFVKEAVTSFATYTHGVNNGEAMKSEALAWRFTGDETDKDSTFERIRLLYTYHGRASGTYSADEHLAGLGPSRGTETCTVVEQIFSLAIIYQIFGNNSVADRAEKIAYNALPSAITYDFWGHQYDQQVNQVWSKEMDPPPFGNNGPRSNIFGFEPNYPCCTVNHAQGYPKFWANSFATASGGSELLNVFLGPEHYSGTLAGGNDVDGMFTFLPRAHWLATNDTLIVHVETLYPFNHTLKYTVTASQPFTFKIRIPDWATEESVITINGEETKGLTKDEDSYQAVQIMAGTTAITLSLGADLQLETRTNGAIAVTYGVLNYAVELAQNDTTSEGLRSAQALGDAERLFPDAPAEYFTDFDNHTVDHLMLPTGDWALAIDPSTIEIVDTSAGKTELPYYTWAPGSQPISMTAVACPIAWDVVRSTAGDPPVSPNACTGDTFNVTLVPFGAAKLRLGEIPTMSV